MHSPTYAPRLRYPNPGMLDWYFIGGRTLWARPSRIRTGAFSRAAALADLGGAILLPTGALPSELRN